jgi:hypothetical protein
MEDIRMKRLRHTPDLVSEQALGIDMLKELSTGNVWPRCDHRRLHT